MGRLPLRTISIWSRVAEGGDRSPRRRGVGRRTASGTSAPTALPLAVRPYRSAAPVASAEVAPPVVTVERRPLAEYAKLAEAAS